MSFCRKIALAAASSAVVCCSALAQLSVTPALPEKGWTHKMWLPRFDEKRALAAQGGYDIVFLGDSITHGWESRGAQVWTNNFAEGAYKALNCGFSGDRTEHVLWRLDHGQLADLKPRVFVLMIGTNNTGHRDAETEPPTDTILGIQAILGRLKEYYPEAKVILHPIFPRGATTNDPCRVRNDLVNREIRAFADGKRVLWCDFNSRLLTPDGVLETSMAKDLLHPGAAGYEIWAEALKPYLDFALGRSAKAPKPAADPAPTALPKGLPAAVTPRIKTYWLGNPAKKVRPRIREKRAEQCANVERYYDAILIGDSITHFWENEQIGNSEVFRKKFEGYKIMNAGFGGDRTQNVLWNVLHGGILDGVHTRLITLMIGTNNTWSDSAEDIAAGIAACVKAIRQKQPQAKLLLMPILPREVAHKRGDRDYTRKNGAMVMPKQAKVNELIRPLADGKDVIWFDLTAKFTDAEGLPDITLFKDGTHPNPAGYTVWADALLPYLKEFCGAPTFAKATVDKPNQAPCVRQQ